MSNVAAQQMEHDHDKIHAYMTQGIIQTELFNHKITPLRTVLP